MGEHFKEVCEKCGITISQCRCPSPNKTITYSVCDACKTGKGAKLNDGEKHLVEFQKDMSGSFFTTLFNALFLADGPNMARMALGFPEETLAVQRFKNEDGYWQDLQERYNKRMLQ